MTIRLTLFGTLGLTDSNGQDVRAVLAQPKRLALLVYLAAARPAGFHRRDTLLGIFWPDFDEAAARASLSRAVHYLRQALGPEALLGRGDQELAVDRAWLACDLFDLDAALASGDTATALSLYQGDLLPGFHADDAAAFNHWLDGERERLRAVMGACATDAATAAERNGDLAAAVALQRRALVMAPYAEPVVLQLMRLLDALGNRAEALIAYEDFTRRYRTDLDAAPSQELHAAADRLRQSRSAPVTRRSDGTRGSEPTYRGAGRTVPHGSALRLIAEPEQLPDVPLQTAVSAPIPSPGAARQPITLASALAIYACAFGAVALLARAAMVGIGLPDWTLPGVLIVMALGLPLTLLTAFVQRVERPVGPATLNRTATGPLGVVVSLAGKAAPYLSWQQTARGGAFALGGFVLLVAAFMGVRAAGVGPFGSLMAAGRVANRAPLLVTDFTVRGADTSLATVLSYLTRVSFAQSSAVRVVGSARASAVLTLMGRPATTHVDLETAQAISARGGIPLIAEGEVAALDSQFIVAIHLIAAPSGEELATARATGVGVQGLINAIDDVTHTLRGRIGESFRNVARSQRLSAVTTRSLAALKEYTQAHLANDRRLDPAFAVARLRDAVAIDPTFGSAWVLLAATLQNVGGARPGEVDSALQHAYLSRAALPASERTYIEGDYFAHGPGRDRARAIAIYQAKVDNGESGAINNLALLFESRREFARAESLFRFALRTDALPLLQSNLAYDLVYRGNWAAADSMMRVIDSIAPDSRASLALTLTRLYGQGEYDAIAHIIDTVRPVPDSSRLMEANIWRRRLALLHGRVAEWALGQRHTVDAVVNRALLDGWPLGRPADGVRRLDSLLAHTRLDTFPQTSRPDLEIATTYAMDGAPERARVTLATYRAEVTDTSLRRLLAPELHSVLGEIALADHRPLDAIGEFRTGDRAPDGPVDWCSACLPLALGRAFDAAGMRDSAVAMFEHYLALPNLIGQLPSDRYLMEPYVHFRLGELYAAAGDRTSALAHYQAFIALYANSDPELHPKVLDARRRIAALTAARGPSGGDGT